MREYYNDPKNTESSIRDGWMHTGDEAVLTDEGYLKIVGRMKDVIIRGGENISPVEIEGQVISMSNVENVQVFGVEDEKYGEEIVCQIKLVDKSIPFDIK